MYCGQFTIRRWAVKHPDDWHNTTHAQKGGKCSLPGMAQRGGTRGGGGRAARSPVSACGLKTARAAATCFSVLPAEWLSLTSHKSSSFSLTCLAGKFPAASSFLYFFFKFFLTFIHFYTFQFLSFFCNYHCHFFFSFRDKFAAFGVSRQTQAVSLSWERGVYLCSSRVLPSVACSLAWCSILLVTFSNSFYGERRCATPVSPVNKPEQLRPPEILHM